jgi:hypothetical protein
LRWAYHGARPRDICELIERNKGELEGYGAICATVAQNTGERGPPSATGAHLDRPGATMVPPPEMCPQIRGGQPTQQRTVIWAILAGGRCTAQRWSARNGLPPTQLADLNGLYFMTKSNSVIELGSGPENAPFGQVFARPNFSERINPGAGQAPG